MASLASQDDFPLGPTLELLVELFKSTNAGSHVGPAKSEYPGSHEASFRNFSLDSYGSAIGLGEWLEWVRLSLRSEISEVQGWIQILGSLKPV